MNHPAEAFRNLRAKFLAIAREKGYKTAYYVLEKERDEGKFDILWYSGLLGELIFSQEKGDDLDLTPTLDNGDHCDFRGSYKETTARFDVTTSLDFKSLEHYEPFQKTGKKYFIALIDIQKRRVDRIIDINFPFCNICGGRLINVALIGKMEFTKAGSQTQTQRIIKVCSGDISHNMDVYQSEQFIPSIGDETEYLYDLYSEKNEEVLQEKLMELPIRHGIDTSLFFSKQINQKVHAVGHDQYTDMDPDGDGLLETKLYWKSDLIDQLLPDGFGEQL